ncbi:S8 family peptidase [Variovorax sp. RB2P76]|uniref:S8 family peptidase n=1 Tax=Variovorax sp. RB2P76 TaxID=3443736 RepID=UPI003F452857
MPDLDHLLATGFTDPQEFRSPLSVVKQQAPDRDRNQHGAGLLAQLQAVAADVEQLRAFRTEQGVSPDQGVAVSLEISPAGSIDPAKQLEWKRDGIEVLNVTTSGQAEVITVFVPDGSLAAFEKRVQEYLTRDRPPTKEGAAPRPYHASLINAIHSFRTAAFGELWTDTAAIPPADQPAHFQVWLRMGQAECADIAATFRGAAEGLGIEVEPGYITFPGRVVVAVRTSRAVLEASLQLLDLVAEIRGTSPSMEFFAATLRPHEQVEWVQDFVARINEPPLEDVPFVTLLDTGVNHGHPLLFPFLNEDDLHSVDQAWSVADRQGHGSNMAGLALHGDLRGPLASEDRYDLPHRLESVKILPDAGANPPHLYGWTAREAVRLVEVAAEGRKRTFAMMTTAAGPTAGMPSEWSATIDRLAFGLNADAGNPLDLPEAVDSVPVLTPRLFVLAAGNVPWPDWDGYPYRNDVETIEDPGQAWNALTVGASTHHVEFDRHEWPSFEPIAGRGALSPSSRTSVTWSRSWPHKPDVVAEGGNGCLDVAIGHSVVVGPGDLRTLTTSHDPANSMLAESGDTSAATAEVARICSHLHQRYPAYWPETIRALVVHGAEYTPAMRQEFSIVLTPLERATLLGRYGHGQVMLETSMNSALKRPTIVLQERIVPYVRSGSTRKLGKVNMHPLPWPREALEQLGEATVSLKITLSYFIQPNPSRRGWQSKFRYQNFGLRFAVRAASETSERFQQRINKINRDEMGEERENTMPDPDGDGWLLRSRLRSRGSLHSDTWFGLATDLANKSEIAVFPVGGWWKEIGSELEEDLELRYALVVSLQVYSDADVDIYTPIAIAIANAVPIVVENQ